MASVAASPTAPTVPRRAPAPASTVSAASDRIPPTTGTAREIAIFAVFTAAASADPATAPLAVSQPTKSSRNTVSAPCTPPRISSATFFRPGLPTAAQAQQAPT